MGSHASTHCPATISVDSAIGGQTVPETCGVCGTAVSVTHAVHATIHTKTDAGVVDYYLCPQCYEDRVAPLFE